MEVYQLGMVQLLEAKAAFHNKTAIFHHNPNMNRRSDCPISSALEIFGDKWSLLIIRDLMMHNKKRFSEFQRSNEKIATNILSRRLKTLENTNLIRKETDPQNKSRFLYSLTEKGEALEPILKEIGRWGQEQLPDTEILFP